MRNRIAMNAVSIGSAPFFVLVLIAFANPLAVADTPPGIVILFSDDAGYADFGFQPDVRPEMAKLTPHIDSIADKGCRFSNAYMSGSVCSPSRAGLMTGKYQQRFGHDNNIPPGYMRGGLPLAETFAAKRFREMGYSTGLIGKWHLGYPAEYHPNKRGFDYFYGCLQGSRGYFPIENPSPHRVFLENDTPTAEEGYITDRIGDAACRFLEDHRNEPFFLFVSFTAPHSPLHAKADDLEALAEIVGDRRRKYAGLVKSMDDNVGKILQRLADLDLEESTIVVFTNDNGGQTQTGANNMPLKGRKGQLWEGGIRVPMAVRWPEKIKAGLVVDDPVISLDLLPTFVAAAGKTVEPGWNWDGTNLLDVMTGKEDHLPERTLFWRRQGPSGAIAARRGKWKMLNLREPENASPQLFDLNEDIGEETDVAGTQAEILSQLVDAANDWESELAEPLWGPNSGDQKERKRRGKKKRDADENGKNDKEDNGKGNRKMD